MGRQSTDWHNQIDAITIRLLTGATKDFPLLELQEVTQVYLGKKRHLTPDGLNDRLVPLIKSHDQKDIAILACAHALSTEKLRDLLKEELKANLGATFNVPRYLWVIIAVNRANPIGVADIEAQCARVLLQIAGHDIFTVGRHLRVLASLLEADVPADVLFCPAVSQIASRATENFGAQLEELRKYNRWLHAREASMWLTTLPGNSPSTEHLLNVKFRQWQVWSVWRPNRNRLGLWDALTSEQRDKLRDILALEGPDIYNGKTTVGEGLVPKSDQQGALSFRYGSLHIKLKGISPVEGRLFLERILKTLDKACSTSPGAVDYFISLCVHNPIDKNVLKILELVNATRDPSISAGVQMLMGSNESGFRITGALQLLPVLNRDGAAYQNIRRTLTPLVIATVEEEVSRLQKKLCLFVEQQRAPNGVVSKLSPLGQRLKEALWLCTLLKEELQTLLQNWPATKYVDMVLLVRADAQNVDSSAKSPLVENIDKYFIARLAGQNEINDEIQGQINAFVDLWGQRPNFDLRAVALDLVQRPLVPDATRRRCLDNLVTMNIPEKETFIRQIGGIMKKDTDMACVNFTRLLMSKQINDQDRLCWRDLLAWMIQQRRDTLLGFTLSNLKVEPWLQWVATIEKIIGDNLTNEVASPIILRRILHAWAKRLSTRYLPALVMVEKVAGSESIIKYILVGWEDSRIILSMLNGMMESDEEDYLPAIVRVLEYNSHGLISAKEIVKIIFLLTKATKACITACMSLLDLMKESSKRVAEGMLAGWLRSSRMTTADKNALLAVANILSLQVCTTDNPSELEPKLQAATEHLDQHYAAIVAEAERLENLRITLRMHDTEKTSALLATIGIEDPSKIEEAIANVPRELVDVIEKYGDGGFELAFPLTHLKPLQRAALGVGNARTMLIRLYLGSGDVATGFCMHLHPEVDGVPIGSQRRWSNSMEGHNLWQVNSISLAPDAPFCHGRPNRTIYQLSRDLWRHLIQGFVSLEDTYQAMTTALANLASRCVVCGTPLGTKLYRSATCQKACSLLFRKSCLEVRLADLRHHPETVDLLLVGIHSAVKSALPAKELLHGCPVKKEASDQALSKIPTTQVLQKVSDISATIKALGPSQEALLSWACTNYRGFLVPATGELKIPSLPSVHQFLLANAAPELEKRFATQLAGQPSTVVFHGTHPDRLYSILRQGLRIIRGGPLQVNGAAHGQGIYVADEPATALSYAVPAVGYGAAAASGWQGSALQNGRIVLGCELAGVGGTAPNRFRVVANESLLIVRYVFLFPMGATAPIRAHVEPAMSSVFASLRSGSL